MKHKMFFPRLFFSWGNAIRRASLSMRTKSTLSTRRFSAPFTNHHTIDRLYVYLDSLPSLVLCLGLKRIALAFANAWASDSRTRLGCTRGERGGDSRAERARRARGSSRGARTPAGRLAAPHRRGQRPVRSWNCAYCMARSWSIFRLRLSVAHRAVFIEKEMEVLKRDKRDLEDLIADTQKQKSAISST